MKAIQTTVFCLSMLFCSKEGLSQTIIPLYETVPNSTGAVNEEYSDNTGAKFFNVTVPTLEAYLPPAAIATRAAVIICPGGSYGTLVIKREGVDVARAFAKQGIAAFVLKYRLPNHRTMVDPSIGPLQDAQQAIKLVREHAVGWHIDTDKIGILGFSAGGHLAACAGTHFDRALIDNPEKTSLRPDFMMLVYPVISFKEGLVHKGSMNNLLGKFPLPAQIQFFSADLQVSPETPPAILLHAADDRVVPDENSIRFYQALIKNHVPAELHLFYKGDHGFLKYPSFDDWFDLCVKWMRSNGWLSST
jgi:acetyl esterase/lipase